MAKHTDCPSCQAEYGAILGGEDVGPGHSSGQREAEGRSQNEQTSSPAVYNPFYTGRPRTPANGSKHTPIDRQEIIRRIKSGGSRPTSPELERPASRTSSNKRKTPDPDRQNAQSWRQPRQGVSDVSQTVEEMGMEIERPRSAFHSGDFHERDSSAAAFEAPMKPAREEQLPSLSTSPVAPWHPDFPSAGFRPQWNARHTPPMPPGLPSVRPARSRASSNVSLASSFVYKPPTSPLVQASRPDTPEPDGRPRSPDRSRRHTFSPQSLQHLRSSLDYPASARGGWRNPPSLRAEMTFPYQAHQPQRASISSISPPFSSRPGVRRPSLSDSPLHLAPMVGSYEESILRGRMSTTPSKPLNFVAQIGVLGKGDCKPSLRCPPHVTVPFPAVFYSYGSAAAKGSAADQPSPYVGLVDLENGLIAPPVSPDKRRHNRPAAVSREGSRTSSRNRDDASASDAQARNRRRQKQKRRSGSPKAPPGGSYRIPQQGQIQVVIKNPNKTAVKLFLIPYDLSDMEPGQKTFMRQRSYSAGPIVDVPLASRKRFSTDGLGPVFEGTDDATDKPMLRYLVHLHICCPSRGRYFLYKSIRVVFANRVPDGKEKLRNEMQMPEPRYSTYKPGRDSNVGLHSPRIDPRRRSMQEPTSTAPQGSDSDVLTARFQHRRLLAQSLPLAEFNPGLGVELQPSAPYGPSMEAGSMGELIGGSMEMDLDAANTPDAQHTAPLPSSTEQPFNFERDRSLETHPGGGRSESLLSRRLKDLAFRKQEQRD